MIKKAEKGKRYRVVDDSSGFFEKDEIVVAIEDAYAPVCVREKFYLEGVFDFLKYDSMACNVLYLSELEEI